MFIKKLFLLMLIINFLAFFPRNLQSDIKFYEKNFEKDREEMINFIRKIVREINININVNILVIDDIFKDITVAWDVR